MGTGRSPGWQHAAPRSTPHYGLPPTFPTWLHTEGTASSPGISPWAAQAVDGPRGGSQVAKPPTAMLVPSATAQVTLAQVTLARLGAGEQEATG